MSHTVKTHRRTVPTDEVSRVWRCVCTAKTSEGKKTGGKGKKTSVGVGVGAAQKSVAKSPQKPDTTSRAKPPLSKKKPKDATRKDATGDRSSASLFAELFGAGVVEFDNDASASMQHVSDYVGSYASEVEVCHQLHKDDACGASGAAGTPRAPSGACFASVRRAVTELAILPLGLSGASSCASRVTTSSSSRADAPIYIYIHTCVFFFWQPPRRAPRLSRTCDRYCSWARPGVGSGR